MRQYVETKTTILNIFSKNDSLYAYFCKFVFKLINIKDDITVAIFVFIKNGRSIMATVTLWHIYWPIKRIWMLTALTIFQFNSYANNTGILTMQSQIEMLHLSRCCKANFPVHLLIVLLTINFKIPLENLSWSWFISIGFGTKEIDLLVGKRHKIKEKNPLSHLMDPWPRHFVFDQNVLLPKIVKIYCILVNSQNIVLCHDYDTPSLSCKIRSLTGCYMPKNKKKVSCNYF